MDNDIENFKFLFQYANFGNLSDKKLLSADYNPEVPLFSAEYQLSNKDSFVKQLRKSYGFNQKDDPILALDGRGNYKSSAISDFDYRNISIYFSKNPTNSVYSSILYSSNPRKEGDY